MKQMEFKTFTISITKNGKITIKKKKGQVLLHAVQNRIGMGYEDNKAFMYKKLIILPDTPLGSNLKI